jgi:hypothetical protein
MRTLAKLPTSSFWNRNFAHGKAPEIREELVGLHHDFEVAVQLESVVPEDGAVLFGLGSGV